MTTFHWALHFASILIHIHQRAMFATIFRYPQQIDLTPLMYDWRYSLKIADKDGTMEKRHINVNMWCYSHCEDQQRWMWQKLTTTSDAFFMTIFDFSDSSRIFVPWWATNLSYLCTDLVWFKLIVLMRLSEMGDLTSLLQNLHSIVPTANIL